MNVVKELVAAANELVAADKIQASEWLTVDQVRGMCAACADSMQAKGISRVKASVILAKMTWEQCISKAKKNPKVDDPEKLCGWLKSHGPNASTASSKTSADVLLQAVAKAIQGKSFMTLRAPLAALNIGKVDMYEGEQMHWRIKTKNGKTIVVVSKSRADAGQDDIEVGNLLVGYV